MDIETLLKEEYFYLQKVIEDFDSKTITIKAWSITGSLAAIGAGLTDKGKPGLFIVGSIASLLFWIIEANYKAFQLSYYKRISQIETYFQNPEQHKTIPLQTSTTWGQSWHETYKAQRYAILWWPAVMLPHLIIFLGGIVLFLYYGK
jgi:hypothetical protein